MQILYEPKGHISESIAQDSYGVVLIFLLCLSIGTSLHTLYWRIMAYDQGKSLF